MDFYGPFRILFKILTTIPARRPEVSTRLGSNAIYSTRSTETEGWASRQKTSLKVSSRPSSAVGVISGYCISLDNEYNSYRCIWKLTKISQIYLFPGINSASARIKRISYEHAFFYFMRHIFLQSTMCDVCTCACTCALPPGLKVHR
jgi:hypothetical protein